ncbi:cytochrome c-type biogenesis protein CcsB [Winogradskyella eximia]|uniref:Cytochrome c-type biogenesis protein CcsB n=1 Tax=Winogradskyella eximia TaxID=262006 RepID=A0A3D9H128_9FLAO|nr:cytochrome c biogenesis protein CcsA [Winogradskyella eximia]RED42861.1 cytochrome c-type biogenesis protein CcsB [Winogradskyella eximia]|tara:strand:- start:12061 stop:15327 length:3267 start_codon:yes stop_codon:yes gene_type:complete
MQKKIANFLFSTKLTAFLFIAFAVAMAVGTILDRNMETSPTPYTRTLIYNAWWFETIMVFFIINFAGNIFRYRLYKKEKWATLILHLSFVLILLGAFITRYIGFEGMMPIREGETESEFFSQKTYISGRIIGDYEIDGQLQQRRIEEHVDFSHRLDNSFDKTFDYGDTNVTIKLKELIEGAEKDVIPGDTGSRYLKIVEAGSGAPHNHFLEDGKIADLHNVLFSLNKFQEGAINITETENGLYIQSPYDGDYMTMATRETGKLVKDSLQPLVLRSRYVIGNMQIVLPNPIVQGEFGVVKKASFLKNDSDGIIFEVTANGETKEVGVLGGPGTNSGYEEFEVGGLEIALKYGPKILKLPFEIKLNDFIAEKYPGTEKAYSSYESKVTVKDKDQGEFDYHIYMNHVLDHGGYRFFQASFDPDEKGTVLSVNHDFWGTYITYAGYMLLYFGLMAILFAKNTRFDDLRNRLEKIKTKKAKMMTMILLLLSFSGFAQEHSENDGHDHSNKTGKEQIDSILKVHITPKEHAAKFSEMVVQDYSGRMMPMHTYASEMLRKLSKKETYEDFNADQIFLSIQESPMLWYNVPIIYLKPRKADSIRNIIGVGYDEEHTKLVDYFTPDGRYKLAPYLEEAYKAQVPNGFQKEVKEADSRVNLLYNTIEGRSNKIFPIPGDEGNKWISALEFREEGYRERIEDTLYGNFINNGFSAYLVTLNNAKQTGDFSKAEELLQGIKKTQQRFGSEVMLADDKIKSEILYNDYDIFKRLFSWYMYAGTVLFVLIIIQIFKYKSKGIKVAINIFIGIIALLFVLHTVGLIWRWYLSGHAPWSDAYESMIYVAWSTMLFGFIVGVTKRKKGTVKEDANGISKSFIGQISTSSLTVAAGAFVTSMILMIAHWNWMDPAIANLQPVLQGYWLMIHVSVIVASYGPFTLGMILGVVALLLMIFTTKENKERMDVNIKELTIINEMALTVGLVMLTIGNFLGGMWANESWGRYWGWDPKETWALISIMIYAFVIHMRLVPGLRSRWIYSFMSILAFGSILMTYFGVNFYLSGLHSYASGDQILSFKFIAITLSIIAVLGFFSYRKYRMYYKK